MSAATFWGQSFFYKKGICLIYPFRIYSKPWNPRCGAGNSLYLGKAGSKTTSWSNVQCSVYWWSILIWLTAAVPSLTAAPQGSKVAGREILTTYCPPETHDACGRRREETPYWGKMGRAPALVSSLTHFSLNVPPPSWELSQNKKSWS